MIDLFAICLFVLFLIICIPIIRIFWKFIILLRSFNRSPIDLSSYPKAAIVLSIRGVDPSLQSCLETLFNQDYPDYYVSIVVDSEEGEAWQDVNSIVRQAAQRNIQVSPLRDRSNACSLKCSALVQAISELDSSYEIIAIIDADVVTHSSWLRELATPLIDNSQIGITSGIRWYVPTLKAMGSLKMGSVVRYLWNVSAAISMFYYNCPWGGSMAMRRSLLHEGGLLELWKRVLSDDNTAATTAQGLGQTIQFVPSVIMLNRESCDLLGCWRFIKRQFLWSCLYHPQWNEIIVRVWLRIILLGIAAILLPIALFTQQWSTVLWTLGGVLLYSLTIIAALVISEVEIRKIVQFRGERIENFSIAQMIPLVFPLVLAHIVSLAGAVAATTMHQVEWRGIRYDIQNPFQVSLLNYKPYGTVSVERSNRSIL